MVAREVLSSDPSSTCMWACESGHGPDCHVCAARIRPNAPACFAGVAMRTSSKRLLGTAAAVACLLLCACSPSRPAVSPSEPATPTEVRRAIGGDRDAHGCLPAAGYRWCQRSGRCERPWELAAKAGFENSVEGYDSYCAARP